MHNQIHFPIKNHFTIINTQWQTKHIHTIIKHTKIHTLWWNWTCCWWFFFTLTIAALAASVVLMLVTQNIIILLLSSNKYRTILFCLQYVIRIDVIVCTSIVDFLMSMITVEIYLIFYCPLLYLHIPSLMPANINCVICLWFICLLL